MQYFISRAGDERRYVRRNHGGDSVLISAKYHNQSSGNARILNNGSIDKIVHMISRRSENLIIKGKPNKKLHTLVWKKLSKLSRGRKGEFSASWMWKHYLWRML
eukprot:TRINITY_DN3628_c0_g1_i11.p3 TRINITY_DN3628_c0_g1~~TRINITY_DN3628_c0_g1_i11.p3  ORF type:complete len:104 (+),score=18.80 TRINITY_DN3628_c0_g1_i11:454-765(+)